ncbi:hypothetical protein BT93_F1551 [Corymbia citriodora subsp. variegata]|nr:hypothetical protein BT93_F1551 [Corymbia citriodora subsp. variegata]
MSGSFFYAGKFSAHRHSPDTPSKMASGFGSWRCLVAFLVIGIGSVSGQAITDDLYNEVELKNCKLYEGSWVRDDSYPMYDASSCPFIDQGFNCLRNGRADKDYLKYRWKPTTCDLPRFDGRDFLERQRGKKIMFVGDSLSKNMWQSLTCLLHSAVPGSVYDLKEEGKLSKFSIPEFGVSVMWLKNEYLVDLVEEPIGRVLKLDSITTGDEWKGNDMLIFNTYDQWLQRQSRGWDYFQVGNTTVNDMDPMEAYRIALTTWSKWVDANIDPMKTLVFFQGISAVHFDGKDWNETSTQTCQGQTQPVLGSVYPGPSIPGEDIVRNVLSMMVQPAKLLDVTLLTQLRKDGHPSIFTGQGQSINDCSHWCLAGVPDTWNELIYTSLILINPNGTSPLPPAPSPQPEMPPAPSPQPEMPPAPSPQAPSPLPEMPPPPSPQAPGPLPETPPPPSPQPEPGAPPSSPPAPLAPAPASNLQPEAPPASSPGRKSAGHAVLPAYVGYFLVELAAVFFLILLP